VIRVLSPSDAAAVEAFLAARAASSMILRSNAAQSGLVDGTTAYHGLYIGAFENGVITDVAAQYWNGMIALQAPSCAAALSAALIKASGRKVAGFLAPWEQCKAAAAALGLDGAMRTAHPEVLYELSLAALRVPETLESAVVKCRPPDPREIGLLIAWRLAYEVETLGAVHNAVTQARAAETMTRHIAAGDFWVVTAGDRVVAMAAISARVAEMVQIGGVYTPPELRGNGYGRAAVAAALLAARDTCVKTGILFTADTNVSAQRAYEALGFSRIGAYGLMLTKD
jgi:GNAT superfamily N-acetyltransferase